MTFKISLGFCFSMVEQSKRAKYTIVYHPELEKTCSYFAILG